MVHINTDRRTFYFPRSQTYVLQFVYVLRDYTTYKVDMHNQPT